MKKIYLLFLYSLVFPLMASGQEIVKGKVVEENGQPLPYANAILLAERDSSVITGCVTDDNGAFALEGRTGGILKVAMIGYRDAVMKCDKSDMGTIRMQPDKMLLEAASVSAGLPQTRLKGESMITDVEGTVLEKEGRASDMLKRLPGVKSSDEGVEIFGRGTAEIYVNGRKVYDYSEVKQLTADQIRDVEIITNPGARYAAGTKAVVRIRIKKTVGDGFSFRDNQSFQYEYGAWAYNQFNTNYRKGGLDVSGMLMGNAKNNGGGAYEYIDTYVDGKLLRQTIDKQENTWKQRQIGTRLQVNYMFNENHSIGARYDFSREPYMKSDITMPSVFVYDGKVMQSSISRIHQDMPKYSQTANLYYNGKVGEWQIDANLDAVWMDNKNTNTTAESVDGRAVNDITSISDNNSRLLAGKLVAEHPLWGGKVTFGAESTDTRRKELSVNPAASDGKTKVDEFIVAGFAEYSRRFMDKLYVQAGLRYEKVISDFYEYDSHTMDRDYDDWFPSLSVTMPVGKIQLGAHYGIDIARPSFANLSSNIIYINSYSFQGGNPYLKPTYTHNISLNASWKWLWSEFAWNKVVDGLEIENISFSDSDPTITLLHPNNIDSYHRLSATVYASPTLFRIWHPAWGVSVQGQDYVAHCADGTRMKMNRPLTVLVCNNMIELPKGWSVNLDAVVQCKGDYSTYRLMKTSWILTGKIQKSFFGDRLETYFQAFDILGQRAAPVMIHSYRNFYVKNDNRTFFELSLTYKFNQGRDKYKGSGAGGKQKARIS